MPDETDDDPDMIEPADIKDHGSAEFDFGCVTGQIFDDQTDFIARRETSSTAC